MLTLLASSGCDRSVDANRPPNVLLITIDTLRQDHASFQGYERDTMPRLEAFAREGARIDEAYAPTATTAPTHATILTSLYPIGHGLRKNGQLLHDELETLAETLGGAGFHTSGIVSSFVLDAKFGFAQGFDAYDDDFDPAAATMTKPRWQDHDVEAFDQPANLTTDKAIRWLADERRPAAPFFLFVHYFDPHSPYTAPEPFASTFTADHHSDLERRTAAYDGEIVFTDREIGRLLNYLEESGLAADTLVVVTADHGEGLMQHGHPNHGVHIYEEAVRVPLLFRLPGRIAAGTTLGGPVELVDLSPTVLELLGLETPAELQGRSLTAALGGEATLDPLRPIYLHRRHYEPGTVGEIPVVGERFGVRHGSWKYIEGTEDESRELFDLGLDPGETDNLYDPSHPRLSELESLLVKWKLDYGRDTPLHPILSEDDLERLKALGYTQ